MATSRGSSGTAGRRRTYFHLQIAAQRLRSVADELFVAATGITTAQAAALSVIAEQPGCTQRALAGTLRQRESAITTMAGRLVTAGLVERRPSAADGRAWALWPTPAGRAALAGLDGALARLNDLIEGAVGRGVLDDFVDVLEAIETISTAPPT